MNRKTFFLAGGPLLACLCASAVAQAPAAKPGDHPAVVAKRLHAQRGYDYATQFYPHPAWLYLRASAEPEAFAKAPATPAIALSRSDVE
jgi:hypothetical protein